MERAGLQSFAVRGFGLRLTKTPEPARRRPPSAERAGSPITPPPTSARLLLVKRFAAAENNIRLSCPGNQCLRPIVRMASHNEAPDFRPLNTPDSHGCFGGCASRRVKIPRQTEKAAPARA